MKSKYLSSSTQAAVLVTALSYGASLRAVTTPTAQSLGGFTMGQSRLETVAFRDGPEAQTLREAYGILARGDHDYHGHRVAAMKHMEHAGKFLGIDLAGDLKDHEKQFLSDDRLREARGMLNNLIVSAEIKDQKRVIAQLKDAVKQIDIALATK